MDGLDRFLSRLLGGKARPFVPARGLRLARVREIALGLR